MPDVSTRLSLPYLMPSQAQKHVTHNEALQKLDALVQLAVEAFDSNTPPELPSAGSVYALGDNPVEEWAGHPNELAAWIDESWLFILPQEGWFALNKVTGGLMRRLGAQWLEVRPPDLSELDGLGINANYDSTNRFSVSAPATLLNHEGAGHQLKLNKAATTDTASLLFQTGFSGRAEMGTSGEDKFAIKVSPDGSTWVDALVVDNANGNIGVQNANPEFPLDVDSLGRVSRTGGGCAFIVDRSDGSLSALHAGKNESSFLFSDTAPNGFQIRAQNRENILLGTAAGSTEVFRITAAGALTVTGPIGQGGVVWTSGSGSPEGVVTAPVGSLYSRTDGAAGTSLYVKESGSGNTGWAAK